MSSLGFIKGLGSLTGNLFFHHCIKIELSCVFKIFERLGDSFSMCVAAW